MTWTFRKRWYAGLSALAPRMLSSAIWTASVLPQPGLQGRRQGYVQTALAVTRPAPSYSRPSDVQRNVGDEAHDTRIQVFLQGRATRDAFGDCGRVVQLAERL